MTAEAREFVAAKITEIEAVLLPKWQAEIDRIHVLFVHTDSGAYSYNPYRDAYQRAKRNYDRCSRLKARLRKALAEA